MQLQVQTFTVHKRFPLTISRGTTAGSTNIWLKVEQDGIEGWGEASPFSIGDQSQTTETLVMALESVIPKLEALTPLDRQRIELILQESQLPSGAWAALDIAFHDWLGKKVGLPLWRLWGLDRDRSVPISVTIGINTPEGAKARVRDWLNYLDVRVLKVKLGSPQGIEADQEMFRAVQRSAPADTVLYVDANGGWNFSDAIKMCNWLAGFGVKYVEQPLAADIALQQLPQLYAQSPLPIFVDESCFNSRDIPLLARFVHGINIKLMKSGGLTEALRMVHTAKAFGLQVMFGCYSDSSLANTAASHLASLVDYLDLDSHLNLIDDPFTGATVKQGCLIPNDLPGLGVRKIELQD
ncbi:dipeptide epimerase [Lyngbya sp. PCC 8106]|uniref:dipeptide epimerase n=1 Tax=Lyngbya sp. (strain PCC 8106) TaxID=313612 RepID=UPI0000EAAC3D|nr:dipeptide epimerase [Lyngbya sp. PCC 8106]EAW37101.1 Mandelate racemase/muconate lactonizing enzyme [Lyngbya sp. PCC 8106]